MSSLDKKVRELIGNAKFSVASLACEIERLDHANELLQKKIVELQGTIDYKVRHIQHADSVISGLHARLAAAEKELCAVSPRPFVVPVGATPCVPPNPRDNMRFCPIRLLMQGEDRTQRFVAIQDALTAKFGETVGLDIYDILTQTDTPR